MLIHGFSLVNARLLKAFGTAFYAITTRKLTISLVLNNQALIVKKVKLVKILQELAESKTQSLS